MLNQIILIVLFTLQAQAQLSPNDIPEFKGTHKFTIKSALHPSLQSVLKENENGLPNIVLIGYWEPSNEMLREFSPYADQNISGWIGKNWEGLGYNVYAFFPEFPNGPGIGDGDFQVDYQKTSADFWSIIPQMKPVAILSFGRAQKNNNWEIEKITRNLTNWIADFLIPLYPNDTPPDKILLPDEAIQSAFPGTEIVQALEASVPEIHPFVDDQGAGGYLCEYLGFHLSRYRQLNPGQVQFATHTHIGSLTPVTTLKSALKISLRTLIASVSK